MRLSLGGLRDAIRRAGYEVTPALTSRLIRHIAPTVILDVGGNVGQFGSELRAAGYEGRIVSFEPIEAVFQDLLAVASPDPLWEVQNLALGDHDGESIIHLASNTASSSLLAPGAGVREHAGFVSFGATAAVHVRRLDGVFDKVVRPGDRVALKVDTQGSELSVLMGAERVLDRIDAALLELSLVPLYDGEPPIEEVIAWMRAQGYVPGYLAPAFSTPDTRRWLQADVLFVRER